MFESGSCRYIVTQFMSVILPFTIDPWNRRMMMLSRRLEPFS